MEKSEKHNNQIGEQQEIIWFKNQQNKNQNETIIVDRQNYIFNIKKLATYNVVDKFVYLTLL